MRLNTSSSAVLERTHEGGVAARLNTSQKLRRLVMASMLWEDSFYVDGQTHAEYVKAAVAEATPEEIASIAIEARSKFKLRHMPLFLIRELARHPNKQGRTLVGPALAEVIQRPDEIAEFLSIYWKDGKQPLSAQVKKGLAFAFNKFNEYEFAKWQKSDAAIKLRDVLFLTHAKPTDISQDYLFKKIVDQSLETPDTWEVSLSGGADKKETFERLLSENKLGALALLRNLRGMTEAGVSDRAIRDAILSMKTERVLPFRFITAAKYAPRCEAELESAMFKCLEGSSKLPGKTVLCVDNSGSMYPQHYGVAAMISAKSELARTDAACALAMLLREICEEVQIVVFSNTARVIRPRRGFALRDEIRKEPVSGTDISKAVLTAAQEGYDRIIVLTDEQSATQVGNPLVGTKGYMVNVAAYQNGIGGGGWNRIDGWSEAIVDYIQEFERD